MTLQLFPLKMVSSIGRMSFWTILILPPTIFLSEKYFSLRLSEVLNKIKLFGKDGESGLGYAQWQIKGNKEPVDRIQQKRKGFAGLSSKPTDLGKPLMTILRSNTATMCKNWEMMPLFSFSTWESSRHWIYFRILWGRTSKDSYIQPQELSARNKIRNGIIGKMSQGLCNSSSFSV